MATSESESYGFDVVKDSWAEMKRKELSRREFLIWFMAAATGLIFAVAGGPSILSALKKVLPGSGSGSGSGLTSTSTSSSAIPKLDYAALSINWWQWSETKDITHQPQGIIFLPAMTGGYTEHVIKAKAGDRLFFSPAKYSGAVQQSDIDDKVTYEVSFGDLPVYYVGKIKTTKTFTSVIEGTDSISDGHWYISEPLKPGHYIGITQGRVPTGNFWEKTKYDITVTS